VIPSNNSEELPMEHAADTFMGREFLIWLWWKSEQGYANMELPHFGSVDFWIDDRIRFRTSDDNPQVSDLKGGAPATTLEARTALAAGKTIETARVGLRIKEREFSLEFRGEGLQMGGLKVPAECKEPGEERLYERMFLLEEAWGIVDALFVRFCEDRLAEGWNESVLPSIRKWVAEA
jgi:hypothetical protein